MKQLLIIFLFTLVGVHNSLAQDPQYDSLVNAGIHQLYNINFDDAESTFKVLRNEYSQHPAANFFDAMIIWWKILLEIDNEELDDLFNDKLDIVIEQCDDILDKDPSNIDAYFFKGGSLGFRGRLNTIRGDWFDAAADGKDALPLVFSAYELDSTNIDVKLGFGIYDYYAAVIPEKYPMVQPLMIFFPDGDKENGIKALELVANEGKYAKYEAQYFLMTLNYSYEKDYEESYIYAQNLWNEFPNNPRFQSFLGRLNVRMNDYPTAIEIFDNILTKADSGFYGYNRKLVREAHYYHGVNFRRSDSLDLAIKHFRLSENISRQIDEDEESGFLINTVLYMGEIYDLQGKRDKAINMYEEVLDFREYNDSHERAEDYLETPYK